MRRVIALLFFKFSKQDKEVMITFVFRVIWNSNIFIANREQPKFLWFIHKFWSWVQILFRIEKVRSLMKLAKEPKNAFLGRNFLDARFGRQTLFDHHRLYASMHAINTTKEHLNMNNVTTWASWNLSINVSKHHEISVFTFNGLRHENEKEIWRNRCKIPAITLSLLFSSKWIRIYRFKCLSGGFELPIPMENCWLLRAWHEYRKHSLNFHG